MQPTLEPFGLLWIDRRRRRRIVDARQYGCMPIEWSWLRRRLPGIRIGSIRGTDSYLGRTVKLQLIKIDAIGRQQILDFALAQEPLCAGRRRRKQWKTRQSPRFPPIGIHHVGHIAEPHDGAARCGLLAKLDAGSRADGRAFDRHQQNCDNNTSYVHFFAP
jgi:hypothetical protein